MEHTMELAQAVKYFSAAFAALPMCFAAYALGRFFSATVETMGRNPSVADKVAGKSIMYFAIIESIALLSMVVSLLILNS